MGAGAISFPVLLCHRFQVCSPLSNGSQQLTCDRGTRRRHVPESQALPAKGGWRSVSAGGDPGMSMNRLVTENHSGLVADDVHLLVRRSSS